MSIPPLDDGGSCHIGSGTDEGLGQQSRVPVHRKIKHLWNTLEIRYPLAQVSLHY